jgi:hypothetical protein
LSWQIDVFDFLTAGSSAAAAAGVAAGTGAVAFAGAAAGAGVVAGAGAAAAALASAGLGSAAKLELHAKHKDIRAKRYVVFFMSILK